MVIGMVLMVMVMAIGMAMMMVMVMVVVMGTAMGMVVAIMGGAFSLCHPCVHRPLIWLRYIKSRSLTKWLKS